MFKKLIAVFSTILAFTALPAVACPDWQAQPYFGQIDLYAGFTPDPYVRNVTAGGTQNMQNCFSNGYSGYVTSRPDFDLYWHGGSAQLTIAIQSRADAILLINAPDGSWHYSDDYRGTDPAIVFNNPMEGLYDIWIGSYDGSRRNPARLIFTELGW
ncbi:MAG: peptidase S1 [Rhodobacteraceae bacterium]|nr:peptidase S1 [Paracoccaceae bacterium]